MAIDLTNLIDTNLLSYFKTKLDLVLTGKVDTETGKGLSTNDYTSAEKTKLAGIETAAQVNVLEGIQTNGTTITPVNKIANITVPTKTSDITNDSGYITTSDIPEGAAASTTTPKMDGTATIGTELSFARGDHIHPSDTTKANLASPTFTGTPAAPTAAAGTATTQIATTAFVGTAITNALANITGITYVKVDSYNALPATGAAGTIYLVPHSHDTNDIYDEYIWYNSTYEKIGNTDIDLSDYVEESEIGLASTSDIDNMFT